MSERYDEEYVRRERRPGDPYDPAGDPGRPPYAPGPGGAPHPPGYPGPGYQEQRGYTEVRGPAYDVRWVRAVWFIVGLIDALLLIRFLFRLLGASISASFVSFTYGITNPLIAPFRGIFNTSGSGSYIFEPESLVAIIIYALIGWGIVTLIRILTSPRGPRPVP